MIKNSHINRKQPDSTKKSKIQDKYTTTLQTPKRAFQRQYIYILYIKNKAHSIHKLLENFGLAKE